MHAGASTELFIVQWARGKGSSPGRVEGTYRAILTTARSSCYITVTYFCQRASLASWRRRRAVSPTGQVVGCDDAGSGSARRLTSFVKLQLAGGFEMDTRRSDLADRLNKHVMKYGFGSDSFHCDRDQETPQGRPPSSLVTEWFAVTFETKSWRPLATDFKLL